MVIYRQMNSWEQISTKLKTNAIIYVQVFAYENAVCKKAAILSRPQRDAHVALS